MKCHFIPQFYLKQFCDERSHEVNDVKINDLNIYDKNNHKWFRKSPQNMFYQTDLYKLQSDENEKYIESSLSMIENEIANIYRNKILIKDFKLTHDDRFALATFIILLRTRNPCFLNNIKSIQEKFIKEEYKKHLQDPDGYYEGFLDNEQVPERERTRENSEFIRRLFDKIYIDFNTRIDKRTYLANMVSLLEYFTNKILELEWHFLCLSNDGDLEFISSDNPVYYADDEILIFPLTPKKVLVCIPKNTRGIKNMICYINKIIYHNAYQYIFCKNKAFGEEFIEVFGK